MDLAPLEVINSHGKNTSTLFSLFQVGMTLNMLSLWYKIESLSNEIHYCTMNFYFPLYTGMCF